MAVFGCSPEPPPIEYETPHLRIGSELDAPLCTGDLVRLEQLIENIEDDLHLEMTEPVTAYIWSDETWWAGAYRHCSVDAAGCYYPTTHTIHTMYHVLTHELVHAVSRGNESGYFFEEGIANLYGGRQSEFGDTSPSDNIGLSGGTIDRRTTDHFVRWLYERWGADKLGDLVRANGTGAKAFERSYGMTVEAAEELYFEEAPFHYTSLDSCDGAPILQDPSETNHWQQEISLDCPSGDDTRTSGIGMIVHRTFEVSEPGYYTFHHDGDWFDIYRCSPVRIEEAILPGSHLTDDVPPEHAGFPDSRHRHYEGQPSWTLYMEAGTHDIGVGLLGHDVGTVSLEISPALGPHPTPPS